MSDSITFDTLCDLENKHYFSNIKRMRGCMYHVKFPGVFQGNERRDYGIYFFTQYPNSSITDSFFTLSEYIDVISVLYNISPGHYAEREVFVKCNEFVRDYQNIAPEQQKRMSDKITKVLVRKKLIGVPIKSIIRYEPYWNDKIESLLIDKFSTTMVDGVREIALRIIFAQKSFGCFITYKYSDNFLKTDR